MYIVYIPDLLIAAHVSEVILQQCMLGFSKIPLPASNMAYDFNFTVFLSFYVV